MAGGVAVGRARMLMLKGTPGGGGAEDAALGVSLAGDAAGAGSGGQGGRQPAGEQDGGEVSHHTHGDSILAISARGQVRLRS